MELELGQFEDRKREHIRIALSSESQTVGQSEFNRIHLDHEPLPEIDFSEIDLSTELFKQKLKSPIFVSSMTAGHSESAAINYRLAAACARRGWAMGVGSQRRELLDPSAKHEWLRIREEFSQLVLFGNIGLSQLISTSILDVERLVANLEAKALVVHANPLQEVIQAEGTPQFRDGLSALKKLARELSVPVILKEVGCGFSKSAIAKLADSGIAVLDVAGLGGTHWGRVEGLRSQNDLVKKQTAKTFENWGHSTVQSLLWALETPHKFEVWASGGVRNGLDVAKLLAVGAQMVGVAKPLMEAALIGDEELDLQMKQLEYELRVALFCTGSHNVRTMQEKRCWRWI